MRFALSRTRIYTIGIDEVGRGPLAGPLCVGACLIRKRDRSNVLASLRGVKDCKKLSPKQRLIWFSRIREVVLGGKLVAVTSFVGESVIDQQGVSHALRLAIGRCLSKLSVSPPHAEVLLDGGIYAPAEYAFQETIIDGDESEPLIALASIVAKVRRDRRMARLGKRYPAYGFEKHKGYGTKEHYAALRRHGLCKIHRRSFLKKFQIPSAKSQTIPNTKIQTRKHATVP